MVIKLGISDVCAHLRKKWSWVQVLAGYPRVSLGSATLMSINGEMSHKNLIYKQQTNYRRKRILHRDNNEKTKTPLFSYISPDLGPE
jgi:hypothetical protein